jgi:hypothetical protein
MVRRDRAPDCAGEALLGAARALQIRDTPLAVFCLDLVAVSAAARGDVNRAAMILGATEAARQEMAVEPDEDEAAIRTRALELIGRDDLVETAWARGRTLDLGSGLELAAPTDGVGSPAEDDGLRE